MEYLEYNVLRQILEYAGASASHRLSDCSHFTDDTLWSLLFHVHWRAERDSSYCLTNSSVPESSYWTSENPEEDYESSSLISEYPEEDNDRERDLELGWLGAHGWETEEWAENYSSSPSFSEFAVESSSAVESSYSA